MSVAASAAVRSEAAIMNTLRSIGSQAISQSQRNLTIGAAAAAHFKASPLAAQLSVVGNQGPQYEEILQKMRAQNSPTVGTKMDYQTLLKLMRSHKS